jgi:hypothetical protein
MKSYFILKETTNGYTYLYNIFSTSKKSALTKYLKLTKEGQKYLTQAVKRKVRNVEIDGVYDPFDDFIVVLESELDPPKLSRKQIESLHKSKSTTNSFVYSKNKRSLLRKA